MRVTVTGATGLLGSSLVSALVDRGEQVGVLSRDPRRARERLGEQVQAWRWEPLDGSVPAEALEGRDAIVHLAGENVAQRWTATAKRAIRDSRVVGTRNLVAAIARTEARPRVLLGGSAVGYYGPRGAERLEESAPAGTGFLAEVCVAWEREAARAREHGVRVVALRTGVVLDRSAGALAKMLPPFRLGLGGPVAGGDQYLPWIHRDDVVGLMLAAAQDRRFEGPLNLCAPEPVTNAAFSRALGRALRRPAVLPVPGPALRLLMGEMAEVVTEGQRAVPAQALGLGHVFGHPDLDEALRHALGRRAPAPQGSTRSRERPGAPG